MEVDQLLDEESGMGTPKPVREPDNNPGDRPEPGHVQITPGIPENETDTRRGAEVDEFAPPAPGGSSQGTSDPVVLNKSGKGIIPYEKHKALRVENSTLREQLDGARSRLEEMQRREKEARSDNAAVTDEALAKHLEVLKADMPEIHHVISTLLEGSHRQGEKLEETLQTLRNEQEESRRAKELSIQEQVVEAKENNPDLVHWENKDPEAWDEALRQDEILRTSSKWANKPYAERFEEVVRRVRAIFPKASLPYKHADPEQTRVDAKAKLETATPRKPTTLSDIQGGANPVPEREQIENLSPHELAKRLMQMPSQKAAALRAELD